MMMVVGMVEIMVAVVVVVVVEKGIQCRPADRLRLRIYLSF